MHEHRLQNRHGMFNTLLLHLLIACRNKSRDLRCAPDTCMNFSLRPTCVQALLMPLLFSLQHEGVELLLKLQHLLTHWEAVTCTEQLRLQLLTALLTLLWPILAAKDGAANAKDHPLLQVRLLLQACLKILAVSIVSPA